MTKIHNFGKTDEPNSSNIHDYAVPHGMRVYVIGDIQGYLPALQKLHDMINQDIRDRPVEHVKAVYLGDYIAKGDFSAQVLDFLGPDSPAPIVNDQGAVDNIFLIGNHEVAVSRFMKGKKDTHEWLFGGKNSLLKRAQSVFNSYGVTLPDKKKEIITSLADIRQEFNAAVSDRGHRAFFQQLEAKKKIGDYLFVHAGINPKYPWWMQRQKTLLNIRDPFLNSRKIFGVRTVTGHTPTPDSKVLFSPSQINVDTGSYKTGIISSVVLEGTRERVLQAYVPLYQAQMQAKKMGLTVVG